MIKRPRTYLWIAYGMCLWSVGSNFVWHHDTRNAAWSFTIGLLIYGYLTLTKPNQPEGPGRLPPDPRTNSTEENCGTSQA